MMSILVHPTACAVGGILYIVMPDIYSRQSTSELCVSLCGVIFSDVLTLS